MPHRPHGGRSRAKSYEARGPHRNPCTARGSRDGKCPTTPHTGISFFAYVYCGFMLVVCLLLSPLSMQASSGFISCHHLPSPCPSLTTHNRVHPPPHPPPPLSPAAPSPPLPPAPSCSHTASRQPPSSSSPCSAWTASWSVAGGGGKGCRAWTSLPFHNLQNLLSSLLPT
jgi:hypothetical protein